MYHQAGAVSLHPVEPCRFGCTEAGSQTDELLMERLSALAGLVDPVPQRVQGAARRAFARTSMEPADHRATHQPLVVRGGVARVRRLAAEE
jgi:hypothetical protein